ncbi:MAG TPA: hypothetical protein VNI34_01310 [Candidatus Nitrosotalea sp.]|nr:hypothetical protein [Candidatus Nitrosotalea sp.]
MAIPPEDTAGVDAQPADRIHALLQAMRRLPVDGGGVAMSPEQVDWIEAAALERRGQGVDDADLVQEGALGLLGALAAADISDADLRRAVSEQMDRAIATARGLRLADALILKAAEEYEQIELEIGRTSGRVPETSEVGARLEWQTERAAEVRRMVQEARLRHDLELLEYLRAQEEDAPSEVDDDD